MLATDCPGSAQGRKLNTDDPHHLPAPERFYLALVRQAPEERPPRIGNHRFHPRIFMFASLLHQDPG